MEQQWSYVWQKKRKSTVNYKGLAKVTRHARRGFMLKFNPNGHWSTDFYVIIEALPRVCMKNTARGECRVVNTIRGEAECCIYHKTPRVSYTQA